jgi:glutathione synthase/RimK-type ligase-like ATP-grasp enzyme
MTNDGPVVIFSTIADQATDEVVRRLTQLGVRCHRINTENYPFRGSLTQRIATHAEELAVEFDRIPLLRPASIWYRRLRTPSKPEEMDAGIYDFCLQENRAAMLGGILSLRSRWMSQPQAIWQAENKPFQLSVAAAAGLQIPRTVVTNDPSVIREAFADFQRMVVKPVRSGYLVHNGQEYSVYTSRVMEEHLEQLGSAKYSPSIYQELVPKRFDLRITIVGRRVFAVAIDSQSDPAAAVDWRQTANPHLPHHRVDLPARLNARLLHLMDSLRLTFGAIDMIETPENDYIFLEINPSGQWLWLDDVLNLGISDAVARWLGGWEPE